MDQFTQFSLWFLFYFMTVYICINSLVLEEVHWSIALDANTGRIEPRSSIVRCFADISKYAYVVITLTANFLKHVKKDVLTNSYMLCSGHVCFLLKILWKETCARLWINNSNSLAWLNCSIFSSCMCGRQ